jgi:hypothetical protein
MNIEQFIDPTLLLFAVAISTLVAATVGVFRPAAVKLSGGNADARKLVTVCIAIALGMAAVLALANPIAAQAATGDAEVYYSVGERVLAGWVSGLIASGYYDVKKRLNRSG